MAAVLLACLALPASATAARVELRPGAATGENELAYTAGPDEVNNVAFHRWVYTSWPAGVTSAMWNIQDIEGPTTAS